MLERIENIQGVGLLHQANGKPYGCQKATLVYADNGRGKSTLATIFRSASTGNAKLITARKTIDGTLPPKVVFQFGSGHKVSFENGNWSEQRSELLVFDTDFIERNVHSGGAVSTDQRKNLLEFALGEAAVAARAAVDRATNESKVAANKIRELVAELSGYHQDLTLAQFEPLPKITEIDARIADMQRRLIAATNVAMIQQKPVPRMVTEPSFDIHNFFNRLGLSLQNVHVDAERSVKQHIEKLKGKDAESWLSQGGKFSNDDTCPFCGQDISSNDLVSAYQTHFNAAYSDLKIKVAALQDLVVTATSENIIDNLVQGLGVVVAQASAWAESVPTQAIFFDDAAARAALAAFREFVADLVKRKNVMPAEPTGTEKEKTKAFALWEEVLTPVRSVNAAIKEAEGLIIGYKNQLTSDSVSQLQQKIQQLQATKRRYDPKVVELLDQLATTRKVVETADKAKNAAREALDGLMRTTLSKYQTSINALLNSFGASFSIKGMSANFRGSAPRSEYGLLLRGKDVALEGGVPSFSTTLSDGDKRTLAFSFFIASTLEDPRLATCTVIIDDPMCSLDANRRHQTRVVLKRLHSKAAQLIVFAHDAYFLRDLRDTLQKENKATPIAIFQLVAAPNHYTDFASLDIDMKCEPVYLQHHRLLNDYQAGKGGDLKSVAKAIRPMLEGYIRRRFAGFVPEGLLFGQVVVLIRDAVSPSPLCHAKNLVDALNDINDYAGQFHHDAADSVQIVATELKTFVEKALRIVHKGAP